VGIIAFQPAAACRRQSMAKHAIELNTFLAVDWPQIARALCIPAPKCPLKVEEIEQVSGSLSLNRVTTKEGKELRRFILHCVMYHGRLQKVVTKLKDVGKEDPVVEFLKLTREWIFGLEDADDLLVRAFAACHDQSAGATLARMITELRDNTVQQMEKAASKPHRGDHDAEMCGLGGQVTRGLRVVADGSSVRIEPGAGVKLADLLPFMLKNGF
jgi:hypothetical protein